MDSWATLLAQWADRACDPVIKTRFLKRSQNPERTLLTTALRHTQGHKQEAAVLLGWGETP